MKTLKEQVEYILQEIPESRNSDIRLTIEIWREFWNNRIEDVDGFEAVKLKDLYDLPREDNVKRIRAHFQNDFLKYLPTDVKVAKQRKINEEVWHREMGMGDVHGRLKSFAPPAFDPKFAVENIHSIDPKD